MRPALARVPHLRYAGHMNWGNLSSGLLGGIIGAMLATLGAWLIERALWARDNRKQEWRELLDAVGEYQSAIAASASGLWGDKPDRFSNASEMLRCALNDRLFIQGRKLKETRHAIERAMDPDKFLASDAPEMLQRCAAARTLIASAARRDLGVRIVGEGKNDSECAPAGGEAERADAAASGK